METLQITKANALETYEKGTKKQKEMLEGLFGKSTFLKKVTDRIKSYSDACRELNIPELTIEDFHHSYRKTAGQAFDEHQLEVVIGALNEGWEPDWNNSSENKYFNYFDMRKGFSFFFCHYFFASRSYVSSRLCFKSSELAIYAATQFLSLYKSYYTI